MIAWHCSSCHHEWLSGGGLLGTNKCMWCGDDGVSLGKDNSSLPSSFFRMLSGITKET